ncbi:peptidylprolyl isomerase [Xanthovirga aplysinae]|uniref:peptidylprolyl isomerase n=1 Tax=Xanthovirga aplysinae TaxID=2529853 RepID=UPI0012BBA638|nr:peptidylprolyl isomerase [Xanthovirga aplysinae]MTI31817.1 peptidylprolyl isomerase [Xanthovirga aplysinae]
MKTLNKTTLLLLSIMAFWSCNSKTDSSDSINEERPKIEMVTDYGEIVIDLYNETPLHRDNLIKLANEGAFDSLLFHRVIENFMIQGGDPDSRNAQPADTLGNGGLPYMVDAEFNPKLFHKKGALGAARNGNLKRASSSMQFYIVQGKIFNDSLLTAAESRINGFLAEHYFKNDLANKPLVDSLQKAEDDKNWERYNLFNDSIRNLAKKYENFERYTIPDAHREVYKSIGGTPHLDQNYTVFGEVVKGLEVVDSIASIQTGKFDRPLKDIRIRTVRVLK